MQRRRSVCSAGRAAGPAVVFSFVVAAIACGFAALCYAELASMIPVSGSAYTYSYATLGEIVAWIIGWDLILEYAVGNMAVAVGWSGYFVKLCHSLFGFHFPLWAVTDTKTADNLIANGGDALRGFSSTTLPVIAGYPFALNLPAFFIVAAVTILLIYRHPGKRAREQHRRHHQSGGGGFLHRFRRVHGESDQLDAVYAEWFLRRDERSGDCLFRLHRIRRGLDHGGGNEEPATRYADRHDRQPRDLHAAVRPDVRCADRDQEIHGLSGRFGRGGDGVCGQTWAQALVSAGALAGMTSVLLVFQLGQPRIFMAMARDGLLPQYFARLHSKYRTPYITTIWTGVVVGGVAMFTDIGSLADLTNIGTLFAFSLVCIGVIILRRTDPNRRRPFRVPMVPLVPILGVIMCVALMLSLPILTWIRFFIWLALGMVIYLLYGKGHSKLQHGIDTGDTRRHPAAADQALAV